MKTPMSAIERSRIDKVLVALCLSVGTIFTQTVVAQDEKTKADSGVCTNGIVDKDKLARSLLKIYPVSALALSASVSPSIKDLPAQRQLFANSDICKEDCSESDKNNLGYAHFRIAEMLNGIDSNHFAATNNQITPFDYMTGDSSNNQIVCVGGGNYSLDGPTPAKDNSENQLLSRLRIRGSADALSIERPKESSSTDLQEQDLSAGSQKSGSSTSSPNNPSTFATADKATFDLLQNSAGGARTSNLLTYIGYAVPTSLLGQNPDHAVLTIVPYVGVNRDIVTVSKGSSTKPSASDTADIGIINQFKFLTGENLNVTNNEINVRPDYLWNFQDGSRLATLNLSYIPIVQGILNTYSRVPIAEIGNYIAYEPIFSAKSDSGYYTNHGNPTDAPKNKDFERLGGEFGIGIVSLVSWLPVDFSTTYVRLYPVNGGIRVGELNSVLSYNFTKYFALSLKYLHGNREDTGKFEKQWELALSAKY